MLEGSNSKLSTVLLLAVLDALTEWDSIQSIHQSLRPSIESPGPSLNLCLANSNPRVRQLVCGFGAERCGTIMRAQTHDLGLMDQLINQFIRTWVAPTVVTYGDEAGKSGW